MRRAGAGCLVVLVGGGPCLPWALDPASQPAPPRSSIRLQHDLIATIATIATIAAIAAIAAADNSAVLLLSSQPSGMWNASGRRVRAEAERQPATSRRLTLQPLGFRSILGPWPALAPTHQPPKAYQVALRASPDLGDIRLVVVSTLVSEQAERAS
ncbi:hypothetical protein B0T25DRAFT_260850 [Lasiosphaeria hispida]|uniref:Uncharacterized protein n=1 Tax=Lasiosphaeria hispida TaxID=260671 RepID=A0AAJ0MD05_9PEZI|nr:hypothetical protein B0T25DRAFT_260850 [Lasiosphaeria hispida]